LSHGMNIPHIALVLELEFVQFRSKTLQRMRYLDCHWTPRAAEAALLMNKFCELLVSFWACVRGTEGTCPERNGDVCIVGVR
jgi:hypothetical protein